MCCDTDVEVECVSVGSSFPVGGGEFLTVKSRFPLGLFYVCLVPVTWICYGWVPYELKDIMVFEYEVKLPEVSSQIFISNLFDIFCVSSYLCVSTTRLYGPFVSTLSFNYTDTTICRLSCTNFCYTK